jgi:hypothetical protein
MTGDFKTQRTRDTLNGRIADLITVGPEGFEPPTKGL